MLTEDRRKIYNIPVCEIEPNPAQPRKSFEVQETVELSESIRQNGLLQPITVRETENGYELIAGERRLRACRTAGLMTVPCIVVECDEKQSAILALLENLQRENLKLFEEAEGIRRLTEEWGVTQEEASRRLGKSQSAIANKLRLLKLSMPERELINRYALTERHARALVRVDNPDDRMCLLEEIIHRKLNVGQTDKLIDDYFAIRPSIRKKMKRTFVVKDIRIFMNTIDHAVDTMKSAGIAAESKKKETEEYIECIIKIPKPVSS